MKKNTRHKYIELDCTDCGIKVRKQIGNESQGWSTDILCSKCSLIRIKKKMGKKFNPFRKGIK